MSWGEKIIDVADQRVSLTRSCTRFLPREEKVESILLLILRKPYLVLLSEMCCMILCQLDGREVTAGSGSWQIEIRVEAIQPTQYVNNPSPPTRPGICSLCLQYLPS